MKKTRSSNFCKNKCKKQCESETFLIKLHFKREFSAGDMKKQTTLSSQKMQKEFVISYQQEMSILFLASFLSGLLSLWFGLSFYDIISFIFQKYMLSQQNLLKNVAKAFFFVICIYQIVLVFKSYLTYQTTTTISIQALSLDNAVYPSLSLMLIPRQVISWNESIFKQIANNVKAKCLLKTKQHLELKNVIFRDLENNYIELTYTMDKDKNVFNFYQNIDYIKLKKMFGERLLVLFMTEVDYIKQVNAELLKQNSFYHLKLKYQKSVRLPPPYDTDCYSYNYSEKKSVYTGQNQCIFECNRKKYYKSFNCQLERIQQYSANSKTFSQLNKKLDFCLQVIQPEKWFEIKNDFYNQCRRQCKMSCVEYHYDVKSKNLLQNSKFLKNATNLAMVNVNFAKKELTVVYVSKAKMTFFDLFYETGSLMSLWFGFSFFSLFTQLK